MRRALNTRALPNSSFSHLVNKETALSGSVSLILQDDLLQAVDPNKLAHANIANHRQVVPL